MQIREYQKWLQMWIKPEGGTECRQPYAGPRLGGDGRSRPAGAPMEGYKEPVSAEVLHTRLEEELSISSSFSLNWLTRRM